MAISDFDSREHIIVSTEGKSLAFDGEFRAHPDYIEIGMPGRKVIYIPWSKIDQIELKLDKE